MGESVLFGDWLIANPKQIEILDFTAWNKIHDGKRNRWRFVPCLTFVVKGLFVEIAGFHEVWAFIDAIIPKLPRRELNEVMKGRSEGPTIIEELSAFLQESERTLLIELVLPDNGDFLRAVVIRGEDRPLCKVPIVIHDKTVWKEAQLLDEFIVVKNNPEDYLIFRVITQRGGSVRPEKMQRSNSLVSVSQHIQSRKEESVEIVSEISSSNVKLWPSLRMLTTESDALEHHRFLNYFRGPDTL